MERKPEHTAIIARIENMRRDLRLSRVKFAAGFGMCPQTYNNFIGQQGSKPNMELLMGVVEAYRGHDRKGALAWILWGDGGPGVSADDRLSRVEADVAMLKGHIHASSAVSFDGSDLRGTGPPLMPEPDEPQGDGLPTLPYQMDPPVSSDAKT